MPTVDKAKLVNALVTGLDMLSEFEDSISNLGDIVVRAWCHKGRTLRQLQDAIDREHTDRYDSRNVR